MSAPEFDGSESSDAMDGPADVAEAYAVATSAVQAGRGPVLDEIARHLREDLIARAGEVESGAGEAVVLPLLAVRLLVQVLTAYGPPAYLLLASLEVAALNVYRRHGTGPFAYAWHVAPDAVPAMAAAMRVQPALWIARPGVTAETHLFGHPVRVDPALAPGAIYLRRDPAGA